MQIRKSGGNSGHIKWLGVHNIRGQGGMVYYRYAFDNLIFEDTRKSFLFVLEFH